MKLQKAQFITTSQKNIKNHYNFLRQLGSGA